MSDHRLIIIPSVPVWAVGHQLVFDRKFHDGLLQYVQAWPGKVRCLAYNSTDSLPSFGAVYAHPEALPFEVVLMADDETVSEQHLASAAVVMASADDHRQLHIAALCRGRGIPCVYVIEMIPETRHQMNRLDAPNRLVRWRRDFFLRQRERDRRAAFQACDGLQANGTPAHEVYQSHGNCLLYFDTRVSRQRVIGEAALRKRLQVLHRGGPLRLGFSGRLIAMKGADHLVAVAGRLRDRGIDCEWKVYGTGELETVMREQVRQSGLEGRFELPGAVDFDRELIPAIQSSCDLYVMLHRQSDPSCTYLETLSCGIPIVGYANRALTGLLQQADVGHAVPMGDIDAVVDAISLLHGNREGMARMSWAAREFAQGHAFEDTFQRRVQHLEALASPR